MGLFNKLILLLLVFAVAACAPKAKKGEKELKISALYVGGNFTGGTVILGKQVDGPGKFARTLAGGDLSSSVIIPMGQWSFAAIGWTGGALLEGTPKCGFIDQAINQQSHALSIVMTQAGCNSTKLSPPGFIDGANSFKQLRMITCSDITSVTAGSNCDGANQGLANSYRLAFVDYQGDALGAMNPPSGNSLFSGCYNGVNSSSSTNIRVPVGVPLQIHPAAIAIRAYDSASCTGNFQDYKFPNGLLGLNPVNAAKVLNTAGNTEVFLKSGALFDINGLAFNGVLANSVTTYCMGPITVSRFDSSPALTSPLTPSTVNLTSSEPTGAFYASNVGGVCTSPITSININSGANTSAGFYYKQTATNAAVTLNGTSAGVPNSATGSVNVQAAPVMQFTLASSAGPEVTSNPSINVTLSAASPVTATGIFSNAGGSATAGGVDYSTFSGSVTFSPGQTSQNITFTVLDESDYEANETVLIDLTQPTGASIGAQNTHTYQITNDDPLPTITIDNPSASEAAANITFTVSLSNISYQNVTFDYASASNTATSGVDFTATSGFALTIPPGSLTTIISVPIINDIQFESPDEILDMNLSNVAGANVGISTGNGTITNDGDTGANVTAIDWVEPDGFYKTGTFTLRLTFDQNVNVTGTPRIPLNTSPAAFATYSAGSGSTSIDFSFTMAAHNVANLDYSTAAIDLNGGTMIGADTNNASLVLPAVGTIPALPSSIVLDTFAPADGSAAAFYHTITNSGTFGIAWGAFSDANGVTDYQVNLFNSSACGTGGTGQGLIGSAATVTTLTGIGEGVFSAKILAYDAAGNIKLSGYCAPDIIVDVTPPVEGTTNFQFANPYSVDGTAPVSWGAFSDTNGIIDYKVKTYSNNGCTAGEVDHGWIGNNTPSTTISGMPEGNRYALVVARDAAYNETVAAACSVDTVFVDTTPPTDNGANVQFTNAFDADGNDVAVTWTAFTDTGSGLADHRVFTYTNSFCNAGQVDHGLTGSNTNSDALIVDGLTNGQYWAKVQAYDGAGNSTLSPCSTDSILVQIPQILSANMNKAMHYVDITMTGGMWGDISQTIPLDTLDFSVNFTQSTGTTTGVNIYALTKTDNAMTPLSGGESAVRVWIALVGPWPNGNETIEINPVASSVYDSNATAMQITETSGVINLTPCSIAFGCGSENEGNQVTIAATIQDATASIIPGGSRKIITSAQVNEVAGAPVDSMTVTGTFVDQYEELAVNDEIMWTVVGAGVTSSACSLPIDIRGNYGFARVTEKQGGFIKIDPPASGLNQVAGSNGDLTTTVSNASMCRVQITRVPHFNSLTVNNSSFIKPNAWIYSPGGASVGGVLPLRVKATLLLEGSLSVKGKGFGGTPIAANTNIVGESINGPYILGQNTQNANGGGGGTQGGGGSGAGGGGNYGSGGNGGIGGGAGTLGNGGSANVLSGGPYSPSSRMFMGGASGAQNDTVLTAANETMRGGGILYVGANEITGSGVFEANGDPGKFDGGSVATSETASGGGAGGYIFIQVKNPGTAAYSVIANGALGGAGGDATTGGGGGGGGGGGAVEFNYCNSFSNNGNVLKTANGGLGGAAGNPGGSPGSNGAAGSSFTNTTGPCN